MTLPELINKHQLSGSYLAARIAMPRGTFNNKLKGNNGSRFTVGELERLYGVFNEMKIDFSKLEKI